MATCPNCKGRGGVICKHCEGRGYFVRVFGDNEKCQRCNNTGTRKCGVCNGTGKV